MIAKKICLLGDFAIGKTSLTVRFARQTFSDHYLTTVGVKIDSKLVELAGQQTVKLVIWDIAGNDTFSSVDKSYLRGAAGVLLVADGCRRNSLNNMLNLARLVVDTVGDCPMVVAVNKLDLRSDWEIQESDLAKLQTAGFPVFKTSAKTGENVEDAFYQLASLMIAA